MRVPFFFAFGSPTEGDSSDLISSDYLGQASFRAPPGMHHEEMREIALPLQPGGKHAKDKGIRGTLTIRVTLHDPLQAVDGRVSPAVRPLPAFPLLPRP